MKRFSSLLACVLLAVLVLSCGDDPSKPADKPDEIVISSLSSSKILPLQEIIIKGSGFGAEQADGYVEFSGIRADEYIAWSATEVKVKVPKITGDGKVKIFKGTRSSNEFNYTLNRDPYIESAGAGAALPKESINIYGRNFGAAKGQVTFNGTPAETYSKWSDTNIVVIVPDAATTGPMIVTSAEGVASNSFAFTVSKPNDPKILDILPKNVEIKAGTTVTIKGENFGASKGENYVEFNGVKATDYESWSAAEIKCKVPEGASSGNVTVAIGQQKSAGYYLEIKAGPNPPHITSISKTSIKGDDDIEIYGNYFGADYDESKCSVYFGNKKVESYSSWSATKIGVVVPKGITDGQMYVVVDGLQSNKIDYTVYVVNEFSLNSIVPGYASIGEKVTLTGKGFGAARGSSVVKFPGADATEYISWSATTIEVKVPLGATDGEVKVQVGDKLTNGVQFTLQHGVALLDMVQINPGQFTMGNPDGDPNGYDGDAPTNKISITKAFYMSKYEITQGEFKKTMNQSNPSNFKSGDNYPVESLTWERAVEFCNRLSEKEGLVPCYTKQKVGLDSIWICNFEATGYRLPTEAEWEYAARAGSTGSQYGNLNDVAWYVSNCGSDKKPHEVGKKTPNSFGLYDMLGNVAEWVNDWLDISYYSSMPKSDPRGPDYSPGNPEKTVRGGYFSASSEEVTAFKRTGISPATAQNYVGFRVVRKK